jgi:hypothetical protein
MSAADALFRPSCRVRTARHCPGAGRIHLASVRRAVPVTDDSCPVWPDDSVSACVVVGGFLSYADGMANPVRVMLEQGKKKRVVASAFDWSGWDRSARIGEDVLAVLAAYRPRYAKVAKLAGFGAEFGATGERQVVERLEGIGMTDFYGLSGRTAAPEYDPMTESECERKIALLRASWSTFDEIAARVSPELRKGPRGGGRERDQIVRHVNGAEIHEFAPKVGVKVPLETRDDAEALCAYRGALVEGIRRHFVRGESAGSWALQFLIRRCAWHMLDHAWEMEDRNLAIET